MTLLRRLLLPVLAVLALALAAVVVLSAVDRRNADAGRFARDVAAFNASARAAPSAAGRPTVTVISDEFTAPSRTVVPVPVWPLLAEQALHQRIVPLGSPGAGYTVPPLENEFGGTFAAVGAGVDPSSRLVVFFGGSNDLRAKKPVLRTAAKAAFAAARRAAPAARLLVIGPATTSKVPSPALLQVRDVLRQAAREDGARFVDPLASRWLSASGGMLRSDQVNLSAKAQETLAARIGPLLAPDS